MYKQPICLSLLVAGLLVLSGCQSQNYEKTEHSTVESSVSKRPVSTSPASTSEVLLTVNGKPKITLNDFERYKDQFFTIQPQYKQILEYMPRTEQVRIDQNIFQNMVNEILFQEWVEKNHVDKRKDYQDDYNMIMEMGKRNLAIKYYQEENPIKITDEEVKKFYEDNKDKMSELMESPGGVNAKAVKFETESDAKDFLEKVKEGGGDLQKIAEEMGHTIEDLQQVNQMSFNVDNPLRQKLLELKDFPAHVHVKANDKSHYVVHATGKDKPEYVPFEQVKPGLENYLKQQKMSDMLTKAAEDLKKKYDINENMKYFTQKMVEAEKAEQEKQEKQKTKKTETKEAMPMMHDEEEHPSSIKGA